MEEILLVVAFIGLLYLPLRLSTKYKLILGIPFCTMCCAYLWWDVSIALHFKVIFTVLMGSGLYRHYRTYAASLTEKTEGSIN